MISDALRSGAQLTDGLVGGLEVVEDSLQGERDRVRHIVLGGDLVDGLSKQRVRSIELE